MIIEDIGSRQLVWCASLDRWYGTTNMRIKKRQGNTRPVYSHDIFNLASQITPDVPFDWYPMFLKKYTTDIGSGYWQRLDSALQVSQFVHPVSSQQLFKVTMDMYPLVPFAFRYDQYGYQNYSYSFPEFSKVSFAPYGEGIYPVTWGAECSVWLSAIYPMYPLLFRSTVPNIQNITPGNEYDPYNNYLGYAGPLYLNNMTLTATEGAKTSITCNYEGGLAVTYADQLTIDPNNYANIYRASNFVDSQINKINEDATYQPLWQDNLHINSMTLKIEQAFEYVYTCNNGVYIGYGDVSSGFQGGNDILDNPIGPRFIELKNRLVSGSVVFLSNSKNIPFIDAPNVPNIEGSNSQLMMYFGGPFFFPMRNVKWQKPSMIIATDEGYLHTYNFIAMADPEAKIRQYNVDYEGEDILSEFSITVPPLI